MSEKMCTHENSGDRFSTWQNNFWADDKTEMVSPEEKSEDWRYCHDSGRSSPKGKIMEVTSDQQGLVCTVRIKVGVRNPDKKGNDHKLSIVEQPIQKVLLLIDGMD